MYRIGIDVGGTFTDLVAVDEAGQVVLAKATSTPKDPSIGVLDGLGRLAAVLGTDTRRLLQATERIVHGTTVATNALLEHKGARVGLLTTEGHRDVIEMREGLKDDRYNLRLPAPEPLVPRARRSGVREPPPLHPAPPPPGPARPARPPDRRPRAPPGGRPCRDPARPALARPRHRPV